MISHENKYGFVHIPKTGGTSIRRALERIDPTVTDTRHQYADYYPPDYYRATVVRNPWDRLVSRYLWLTVAEPYMIADVIDFRVFAVRLCTGYYNNNHLISNTQCQWLRDVALDQEIIFPNLQEGFNTMCKNIGLESTELGCLNKTKHAHYSSYYTDDLVQLVGNYYANDITRWKFTFDQAVH